MDCSGYSTFGYWITQMRKMLKPFNDIATSLDNQHHIIPDEKLSMAARCALKALSFVNKQVVWCFTPFPRPRHLAVMKSDTADAYTDGDSNIFINIRFLQGADGPGGGVRWAVRVMALLLHEYCHDFNSGVGHIHDEEFYEHYHEATSSRRFGEASASLFHSWCRLSREQNISPGVKALYDADSELQLNDEMDKSSEVIERSC
jgi:hypothetical protein